MIEMFDPQYYLQMYRELQAIAPELEAQEAAKIKERRKRIHRQYDEAIRKKQRKQIRENLDTDKRREQQRIAQKTFRERQKRL